MNQHTSVVTAVKDLSTDLIERMAAIYLSHYDASSVAIFRHDLSWKDEALLLFCDTELVGFTTIKVYVTIWQGSPVRIVYSGDTIVSREHWGKQQLAFAWIDRVGQIKGDSAALPLYWFLLVKGHRTFRYLPVFAKSFFPHWQLDRTDLKPLADQLASQMFGHSYNASSGVVEYSQSRGHLKQAIAYPAPEDLAKPATSFFLARNPGYMRGHELVCICELETDNLKPLAARIFSRAALTAASSWTATPGRACVSLQR